MSRAASRQAPAAPVPTARVPAGSPQAALARPWTRTAVRRLAERIGQVFPDAPAPPYDPGLDMLVPQDRAPFRGRRWREIVAARLPYDAVFFFDDAHFRYYLPAYLLTVLRWPRRAANTRSSTVASLVPPGAADPERPGFVARMAAFTPGQTLAIRDFLRFAQAFDPVDPRAKRALRRYWDAAAEPSGRRSASR